ncbi:PDZ domain-containing protein [bacterium]|nr:PDZ domain-containing protein [bacterium]
MASEVKVKNILSCLLIVLVLIFLFDVVVKPYERFNFNFINKFIEKTRQSQDIAPDRLFINAWRMAKIEYVDKSMNNQDWYRWRSRYVKQIKTIDDANVAINTMLASLNDPYTKFLKSKSFSEQKIILDSKITGVGVMFNKSGDEIVVNHVLKNSPAQSQHIMPGDSIVSINNKLVKDMTSDELHSYIESAKEKEVKFVIKRGDEIIVKDLEKKEIPIDTMDYRITKDNIGIIYLANVMGEKAVSDFANILLKTNNTKGIIIDLRNNYGGILANAVLMADFMILDEEKILRLDTRSSNSLDVYADDGVIFKKKPIVILINSKTASAAEILAGALKCSAGAILVGENTFGKNSIQQVIPMTNSTGMMLTSAKYILPDGADIHNKGIKPDYIIKSEDAMKEALKLINQVVKKEK